MFVGSFTWSLSILPLIALSFSTYILLNIRFPALIRIYVMSTSPAATTHAFHNVYSINAFRALEITIQYSPSMKYANVISDLSSNTLTAYSAAFIPPYPRKNFPGPKINEIFNITKNRATCCI